MPTTFRPARDFSDFRNFSYFSYIHEYAIANCDDRERIVVEGWNSNVK